MMSFFTFSLLGSTLIGVSTKVGACSTLLWPVLEVVSETYRSHHEK